MNEFWRGIFTSLFSEAVVVALSRLTDDKNKVLAFLVAGTAVSGILGYMVGTTPPQPPPQATPAPTATQQPTATAWSVTPAAPQAQATNTPVVVWAPTTRPSTPTNSERARDLLAAIDEPWGRDWPRAIDLLMQARTLDPSNATVNDKLYVAYYNYGDSLVKQGRNGDAVNQLLNALNINPNGVEAQGALRALTPAPVPAAASCSISAMDGFGSLYARNSSQLGCPSMVGRKPAVVAEQPFQNGHMFALDDTKEYFVVYDGAGDWQYFRSDEMSQPRGYTPPGPGLQEPIRGFAWVWQNKLNGPNSRIGWGTDKERGFNYHDRVQQFMNGWLFQDSDGITKGLAYVLINDGRMYRQSVR